eukprot:scaffold26744_cov25-Tisochrysis_lutea.AAC.2
MAASFGIARAHEVEHAACCCIVPESECPLLLYFHCGFSCFQMCLVLAPGQVMDKRGEVRDMYTLADSGVHQREDEVTSIAALLSPSQVGGAAHALGFVMGPREPCQTLHFAAVFLIRFR